MTTVGLAKFLGLDQMGGGFSKRRILADSVRRFRYLRKLENFGDSVESGSGRGF